MAYTADDRRYMTHEQRAQDDPRYRGKLPGKTGTETCTCGKTVYRSNGSTAGLASSCPRDCDGGRS